MKSESKKFVVRMPPDMHQDVEKIASETHISMNGFFLQAVQEKLRRSEWLDTARDTDDGK